MKGYREVKYKFFYVTIIPICQQSRNKKKLAFSVCYGCRYIHHLNLIQRLNGKYKMKWIENWNDIDIFSFSD